MTAKDKPEKGDEKIRSMMLRLTDEQADMLERVAARVPFASRSAVALEAMRIGLELVDRDPALLVAGAKDRAEHVTRLSEVLANLDKRLGALEADADKGKGKRR